MFPQRKVANTAILFQQYFLNEVERTSYENDVLHVLPELSEKVFDLDDSELEELVEQIKGKVFFVEIIK
ncbi:hypothetical protein [Bacillus cihuensis]|uniref:hypothetical protein n=1 Tax=Bacillus cihuensis TaxID=1208599 RepID=UPI0003FDF45F|nr:hypothetical protein [Bacillus cihuensis]